ncbi:hypothetical protein [Stenotrophomonas rhizophila]|uniref:hypothetical protein n=1 Tax=Stenotrophomonas rhizophila TaxID=216778 RepID=UPI001E52B3B4|nr:hypothetical protein [Stenotrophomonas rhizophila]MCC7635588.1 hypothetical protein [Stenotrophomonas rhizophila]MCC7664203.1 hypothetical protein [Stenotrophomonas rhizophila]
MPLPLPNPLFGRRDAVGNIESLLLAGARHYFGHDPDANQVLSPLFQDPAEMAHFAACFMRKPAGPQDVALWRKEVDNSKVHSHRWPTPLVIAEVEPTMLWMSLFMATTHDIGSPADVPWNMLHLLRAVYGDIADGRLDAMFDWATATGHRQQHDDAIGWAFDAIHGACPPPLSPREIANALQSCLGRLAEVDVGNWSELFGEIIHSCNRAEVLPPTPEQVADTLLAGCPFTVLGYAEIADKVPETSLFHLDDVSSRSRENIVLCVEGDLRLDRLDLDDPLSPWRKPDAEQVLPWFILVTGSVFIERHIWSLETDGACGLVALGDLATCNAIVGGQQIHVGGNLTIDELYWGDYNHGCLHVSGDTKADLLIQTDYHMDLLGKVSCLKRVDDLDALHGDELRQIIAAECLIQHESEPELEWSLDAAAMLERLQAGHSVICKDALIRLSEPFTIPSLFADANISPENFLRVSDPDLLPDGRCLHSFQHDGLELTSMAYISEEERIPRRSIFIKDLARGIGVSFTQQRETTPRSWTDVLLLRKPQQGWVLFKATCSNLHAADPDWVGLDGVFFAPEFNALILNGWAALQQWASNRHWIASQIPASQVRSLLALPVAAPYDDYEDSDRNGLWLGHFHAAFRQQGIDADGDTRLPILRLSRSYYCNASHETRIESYYYDIERCEDGVERVRVRHLVDQDGDQTSSPLDAVGGQRLLDAARLFQHAAARLQKVNAALMEGNPPFHATDDEFAMRHWRDLGYLHS